METTTISIGAGRLSARIDTLGAQLMSLKLDDIEYLWQGDPRWWPRRSPGLFPIVGSLRPGTVSAAGPCPMGRHGVARSQEFSVVMCTADSVALELAANDATLAAYPYRFRLRLSYAATNETGLEQRFEVENTGEAPMPYVLGGHPAFALPLGGPAMAPAEPLASEENPAFEGCALEFARPWSACSPTMVPGELLDFDQPIPVVEDTDRLPLSRALFATDTLVLHDVPERMARLTDARTGRSVRFDFPGFDYLGVWSAANGAAPFVAIEPWLGCATATNEGDHLEEKRGMRLLAPGATATHAFTMTLA